MATSATTKKDDSFDEKFFKFLFNNRFDPLNVTDYKGTYIQEPMDLYNGLEGVKEYDEFKNVLINRLEKAGNYDMLDKALRMYNNLYGDLDKGNEGVFDLTKLSPINDLKKGKRELGFDNMSPEDVMKMMGVFRDAMGISVGNGTANKNEWGYSSDSDKAAFAKMVNERLQDPVARREAYRKFGYVMPEKGDDQYLIDDLYNLTRRADMIRRFNEDLNGGAKVLSEFALPYMMDSYEQGKAPTHEYALDLLTIPAAGGAAVAKNLPSFIKKVPVLQKFAGAELDNVLAKLGLGQFSGVGFDVLDNALDSLQTNHVYSNLPGEEDSKRGDALDALFNPDLAKAAIGIATAAGSGTAKKAAAKAFEKTGFKKATEAERKALNKERESYLSEDNPLNVSKEDFEKDMARLKEIGEGPKTEAEKNWLTKMAYFALVKGMIGNPATQMLLNTIGLGSLFNSRAKPVATENK